MRSHELAFLLELDQIAPDGHLGNGKLNGDVGHGNRAAPRQSRKHMLAPDLRQHPGLLFGLRWLGPRIHRCRLGSFAGAPLLIDPMGQFEQIQTRTFSAMYVFVDIGLSLKPNPRSA
jgi:hypothetical protein